MDTHAWPFGLSSRIIKTARQRKRLQKKDFEKQLLALHRKKEQLWTQQQSLPMVPLKEPYQKGWKRFFILRDDVSRSSKAAFFEALLEKINTVQYDRDKAFKIKRRRKRRKVYEPRPQYLRAFHDYEWNNTRFNKLTDAEKQLFYLHMSWCKASKRMEYRYVCSEPWRFVLRIAPNMITEAKMVDQVLEQEIAALNMHIDRNHLRPAIARAMGESYNAWWRSWDDKYKYKKDRHHQPLHAVLGQCREENNQYNEHDKSKRP